MAFVDGAVVNGRIVVILPAPHRDVGEQGAEAGAPPAAQDSPGAAQASGPTGDWRTRTMTGKPADAPKDAPKGPARRASKPSRKLELKPLSPASKVAAAKAQAASLAKAAQNGVPFCEECERAKREQEALQRAGA